MPETGNREVKEVIFRPYKEVKGRKIIYPNDILFARIEPSIFNRKYIWTDDLKGHDFAFTSTEFYILTPLKTSVKYLFNVLFLDYLYAQVEGRTTGSTGRRRLDIEVFKRLDIPFPNQAAQEKIENIFENAFQRKTQKEAKAEELLNGVISYLLDKLGIVLPNIINTLNKRIFKRSVSELLGGRFDPRKYETKVYELLEGLGESLMTKVKLKSLVISSFAGDWGDDPLKVDNSLNQFTECLVIRSTEFDNEYNIKINENKVRHRCIKNTKLHKLNVQQNDILIEKSGGSENQPVGRVAFLSPELVEEHTLCYSNFVHKIRVDDTKIIPKYLFFYLKLMHEIKLTEVMQSYTNGIRNLIMKEYFDMPIILPTMEVQQEIVDYIDSIQMTAKKLQKEAKNELKLAKEEVEKMILGDD